jgi:hypothetical protein
MPKLSWLHLTDLHRGMTSQGWLWPNIQEQFFQDIRRVHQRCGPFDIIFFSGDLVQRGDAKEFLRFEQTMKRLYELLNQLGSDPVFLSVPGNHDLRRPDPAAISPLGFFNDQSNLEHQQAFWTQTSNPARLLVRKSFAAYSKWMQTHPFRRPSDVKRGILPGDFSATIEKGDLSIGVLGLNTAFRQLSDGPFEGRLPLSMSQIVAICGDDFADWFASHTCCFLMTHHPPSWLEHSARATLRGEIAIPGRFVAHLCGHMHESLNESRGVGGDYPNRLWQGCSLFGLEYYGDEKKIERRHGYSAGVLEVSETASTVRLWPRRAEKHQGGFWHFVIDTSVSLDQDEATAPELVYTRYKPEIKDPRARAKFCVCLLATDTDLALHRKNIAEHLRRSLGVVVGEGTASSDASTADLVIILQGWWWSGGECVKRWQEVDPEKRIAFVVEENSDWPPRRLAEIGATQQIIDFRQSLPSPITFSHPDNLAELVSKVVTERMQPLGGGAQLGLREWERKYLEFRLAAWRNGRTAQSTPHLFDAQEAEELYQPDLYVALDGVSLSWKQGADGLPQRIKRKSKKARKQRLEAHDSSRRVPLARWICVPELPRIALVGAPGGGKTIFLTRVAAAMAHACVGRAVDFEPDLRIDNLRRGYSLPIPVVLEAVKIAQCDPRSADALAKAIQEEIAATGAKSVQVNQIEEGLKAGRYLVLIDALDEIADSGVRLQVLTLLKGIAATYSRLRFVLTTRSAKYTGDLRFGPELETVEVSPLEKEQVQQLCENWSVTRNRDQEYTEALLSAAWGLSQSVGGTAEDQALTENPLMLTAICMVFETYRSLPDDRGRLCELLIDDLCRSRRSEDIKRAWKLDESQKKDLLQRIALGMQEEGAQTWSVERAIQVAMQLVPTTDDSPWIRAKKYVDWAADHTGILRFQEGKNGTEEIRFWHRIFREYLSAKRVAQEDTKAGDKIASLWKDGRLCNPFWEDVIRLLPRTLGTIEKAKSMLDRLEELAANSAGERGRLLGLAAAAIIENRDQYPEVRFSEMAARMAQVYENEGLSWMLRDRLLFLECLGRLDPRNGDPRLLNESWIPVSEPLGSSLKRAETASILGTSMSVRAVTVQEFLGFLESEEFTDDALWTGMPPEVQKLRPELPARIQPQMRHPNWPVIRVGVGEAIAFCRWKTRKRDDGKFVRLPTSSEISALLARSRSKYPWGNDVLQKGETAQINYLGAGIKHLVPVGSFPPHPSGASELIGNAWQWVIHTHVQRSKSVRRVFSVFGCSFLLDPGEFGQEVPFTFPADELEYSGHFSITFRCALADSDVRVSAVDFARPEPKPGRAK